jgi:hypothetical protein
MQSEDAISASEASDLPESVYTASMTTKLVDDIKVIDPGSIPVEILDLPLSSCVVTDTPLKQTVTYRRLHSDGPQQAFR